ncbi:hypothetical protein H180DRAFT_01973 [Streptomyces sp. WMMB 322]|nr:hypothetical protein H180DRAFT_01973 [Streptomyces sp. WMMB 322]
MPAAYGAVAGMQLLAATDPAAVAAHVCALTGHLHDLLTAQGEDIASPANDDLRGPQVALRDRNPDHLAGHLAARRIITSPRNGLLRLAVHYYTTESDVDSVVREIARYRTC